MSSGKLRNLRRTLALRLTLWYAGIFAASSTLAFVLVYVLMVNVVAERTDDDLEDDLEEFAVYLESEGLDRVRSEMAAETVGEEAEDVFIRLWSPDGREVAVTDLETWRGIAHAQTVLSALNGSDEPALETLELPGREHAVRIATGEIGSGYILQIGQSLEEDDEFIGTFLTGFLITLVAVMLLGAPVGWFMARHALRGVRDVTRTASEIASGSGTLDQRVEPRSQGDELAQLASTFNAMLDRIQTLIVSMREMTDNLAHDLRSPLARIRAVAESARDDDPPAPDNGTMADSITEECDRLLEIINANLDIAEAESGAARLNLGDVDLAMLAKDAIELFEPVAEDRNIRLRLEAPDQCVVRADRQRLQRAIANLLDNALKYTAPGGQVEVRLKQAPDRISLSIKDTGIGIAAEHLGRVFERFYRCDPSRSERGNGLGLSLAQAFVRAHGGKITVASELNQGSVFTLTLPHPVTDRRPGDIPTGRRPVHRPGESPA